MSINLDELPGDPNKAAIVGAEAPTSTSIEEDRAVAESQAGFVVAKRFPRDQGTALSRVLQSCQRKSLAEQAEYVFPRGGTTVSGPSIRLAEAIAQNWGNIAFGVRELQTIEGASMVMAYCYDLETNTRAERIFTVKHVRTSKAKGTVTLTDPRDIYEMTFNQAARRLRACILQVIPGDVVELATEACRAVLAAGEDDVTPENVAKMVKSFEKFEVTEEMLVARMGMKLSALAPAQMVTLRKIWTSLNDGMSPVNQWFPEAATTADLKGKLDQAAGKATKKAAKAAEKAEKEKKPKKTTKKKAEKPAEAAPEAPPGDPKPPADPPEDPNAFEQAAAEKKAKEAPPEREQPDENPPEEEYPTTTLEVGPKPSQWAVQVEGLRNRGLTTGVTADEWHEAVMSILVQMGYEDINTVPVTKRPTLKNALVILVESLEEEGE
jgi:hypothetical protein